MAAAVIEALFYGNETFDFDPTRARSSSGSRDDPNLNEQTRFRLMEASEKLDVDRPRDDPAAVRRAALEPGKVYFLNTQKLTKNSLLVRGDHENDGNRSLADRTHRQLPFTILGHDASTSRTKTSTSTWCSTRRTEGWVNKARATNRPS